MKNILKRTITLLICVCLVLSFAGCHKPGELAVTVGDEEFSSGFYACAFLSASVTAQNRVYDETGNTSISDKELFAKTIDGTPYAEWVKKQALEICKQMVAAKQLCEQNTVDTAKYIESAKTTAESEWKANTEYFEKNGIGLESYKKFCAYEQYSNAYFDYLYGEGGPEEVTDDVLNKYITDNYVYVNAIDADVTKMDETKLAEQEKKFNGYIDRIKKGESFAKIYSEVMESTYTEDTTDDGTFSNTYGIVWGNKDTSYESDYFDKVKEMEQNSFKIITDDTTVQGYKYMILIYKGNILSEKNTNLETIKGVALSDMKGDEFTEKLNKQTQSVTAVENEKSTKQFKVDKVYLPDTSNYYY